MNRAPIQVSAGPAGAAGSAAARPVWPLLVALEWRRTRSIVLFLALGVTAAALAGQLLPFAAVMASAAWMIFPVVAGVLLGAGALADDAEQGTLAAMLSLPVGRLRLWAVRVATRLALLAALEAFAFAVFAVVGRGRLWFEWLQAPPSAWLLALAGLLAAGLALAASQVASSTFDAAVGAGFGLIVVMAVLRQSLTTAGLAVAYSAAGLLLVAASFDLAARREPPGSARLYRRGAVWLAGLAALVAVINTVG